MISSGNRLAQVRVNELQHLQGLLARFSVSSGESGTPTAPKVAEHDAIPWSTSYSDLGNDLFRPSDFQAFADFLDTADISSQNMFSSV